MHADPLVVNREAVAVQHDQKLVGITIEIDKAVVELPDERSCCHHLQFAEYLRFGAE